MGRLLGGATNKLQQLRIMPGRRCVAVGVPLVKIERRGGGGGGGIAGSKIGEAMVTRARETRSSKGV